LENVKDRFEASFEGVFEGKYTEFNKKSRKRFFD